MTALPDDTATSDDAPIRDIRHASARRSLLMCGGGALLGLAVAGMSLFTAQGTRIAGVPAEDVAIVNQAPILLNDYVAQLSGLYNVSLSQATPQQKRQVLHDMIREELYVQRGVELGLQNDVIEVRTALIGAVEGQQAIDVAASQPDEAELRRFYNAHRTKYATAGSIAVDDYVTLDPQKAASAAAALQNGRPIAEVAARFGLRRTNAMTDGEEFYFAARLHLAAPLFDAARRTSTGGIAGPVQVGHLAHVMLVQLNDRPVVQSFAAMSDKVLTDYRADKVARMQAGADAYLLKRADIQVAKGFE